MAQEDDALQPKKGFSTKARDFGRSIWNPQKKEFIGRTATSWAKIGLFYMIFYSCLAGFFAIMLVGFFSTLSDTQPTQKDMFSLIKANPGMGFRPMAKLESTLIRFNILDNSSYKDLVKNIKETLAPYQDKNSTKGAYVNCSQGSPKGDEVCEFDLSELGEECTEEKNFGYKSGTPCVLLKINRVFNWVPDTINCNMSIIDDNKMAEEGKKKLKDRCADKFVGITCEGETDSDADNIGEVEFYPSNGFSSVYFPYMNKKGYLSPLVFARFKNVRAGALIQVWCKLWEKNIKHHKNDKAGSVHFELVVDIPRN